MVKSNNLPHVYGMSKKYCVFPLDLELGKKMQYFCMNARHSPNAVEPVEHLPRNKSNYY